MTGDRTVLVRVTPEVHALLADDAARNKRPVAESASVALRVAVGLEGELPEPEPREVAKREGMSVGWAWPLVVALIKDGWLIPTGDGFGLRLHADLECVHVAHVIEGARG